MQFDTEGASGIVARAYGTACRLLKVDDMSNNILIPSPQLEAKIPRYSLDWRTIINSSGTMALIQKDTAELLSSRLAREIHSLGNHSHTSNAGAINESLVWAQSSDDHQMVHFSYLFPFGSQSDKPALATGVRDSSTVSNSLTRHAKVEFSGIEWTAGGVNVDSNNMFQSEVQLLSLKHFPSHVRIKLGGLVLARSVKFLGKLEASVSDQETREGWWAELRDEIKSHAKVMCCKHIIGYTETCTIYGEVCILTAIGTAASLKGLSYPVNHLTHHNVGNVIHKTTFSTDGTISNALTPPHRSKSALSISSPSIAGLISIHKPNELHIEDRHEVAEFDNIGIDKITLGRAHSNTTSASKKNEEVLNESGILFTTPTHRPGTFHEMIPSMKRRFKPYKPCIAVHVPYNHRTAPFSFMRYSIL